MALSNAGLAFLDALGLSPGLPTPRFFEDVLFRFGRVPYETLTREGPAPDPDFDPEAFFAAFAEEGGSAVGLERTLAFHALAVGLGFDVRPARALTDGHPALTLLARLEGRDVLADVSLPLPVVVPLAVPGLEIPSPYGRISSTVTAREARVLVEGQGRLAERIVASLEPETGDALAAEARRFPAAPALREPFALRLHDDRLLFWSQGTMAVADPWSLLTYSLPGKERRVLEALFGLTLDRVALAEGASSGPATLTAYDRSHLPVPELLARLSSPDRHLALRPDGTRIESLAIEEDGFVWTVTGEDGRDRRVERVRTDEKSVEVLHLEGESPVSARRFGLESDGDGTRVTLAASLSREVPPAGPGEAVRKTLVFHLVSELLALSSD